MHTVEIDESILAPEEGLLLGNGNLSVSIYQKPNLLVWRFGKNDVWDRRVDMSRNPEPTHIDELVRGIRDERWVNDSYHEGGAKALGGAADEKRMKEICRGTPSITDFPYPCPKPVGELALCLPADQRGLKVHQKLAIEKGVVDIVCSWSSGVSFHVQCFVPPVPNVLAVRWHVHGWNDLTATGEYNPPVNFSLYRWPDPHPRDLGASWFSRALFMHHPLYYNPDARPLPPPEVRELGRHMFIEQRFYPDHDFTEGFRYGMLPLGADISAERVDITGVTEAHIRLRPRKDLLKGRLAIAVPTSTDTGGMEAELLRIADGFDSDPQAVLAAWEDLNEQAADRFWGKSSFTTDDKLLETVWYETLHARRCAYRHDTIAPGLVMPSTLQDFSLWHGDYHMDFNYQQPFWGDYTANHVEVGDAFFPGMQHVIDVGRIIARKYWNCRGTFVHVAAFPFTLLDDYAGSGSLCRLAYMTGWVASHYWWRYSYTQDRDWLRDYGYPVIRDCALFYTDFLERRDDGLYHAFPSAQGESHFTGNPEDFTDKPQVIRHARYCLRLAVMASEILGSDEELREEWKERRDNLPVVDFDELRYDDEQRRRYFLCPPEFYAVGVHPPKPEQNPGWLRKVKGNRSWYASFNITPWSFMTALRNSAFDPDTQLETFKDHLRRWRLSNGTLVAMSVQDHGHVGMYGESQGILAPIQEMMLQSWDGAIRVFPAWPTNTRARFTTFRAEGAFLVTASWADGCVEELAILSESGGECRVAEPACRGGFRVVDGSGRELTPLSEQGDILSFDTVPGGEYRFLFHG